ncbi:MAG: DUF1858 domain-containing protein [Candidatus Riflebacteria bacterium]
MDKITADNTISEVLKINPKAKLILMNHGMYCFGCAYSESESLKTVSEIHQIDLELLLKDLNEF